ncbi:MAG TPA: SDR family oxidoreductase, partial [Candidatus Poseidoniales archaeon]|nr:SDR family oxidoreductase [Candidatus Poseidoniales archaeon]
MGVHHITWHSTASGLEDETIHAAALADVGACVRNPTLEHEMNVTATSNILETCKKHNLEKFVFVSSASVYGTQKSKIFREDQPCFPISNYG